ncbi:MAG: SDR family NAD(P)-dependent oxidoreductase [Clostridiales bacterium]|nr:SDR family NAD(P)-dependent oxidoreductase [Clostridiales bacterium]
MKIAIVTGASSGLGGEFVRQLGRKCELDEIWVIARRRERLEALQADVHTKIRPIALDLTADGSIEKIGQMLGDEKPDVAVLVNAAGFGKIGSWRDISPKDASAMIDLNCRAAVQMTQLVLPFMRRGSRVLEICSTAAFQPFQYFSVYSASKAFLYRYSRALRVELFSEGISVTAVCPYWIKDTEFIGTARQTKNSSYVRHFPLASRQKNVVRWALIDAKLRLPVSTPGPVCLVHRIAAKFIPSELMIGVWALLRRI